MDYEEDESDEQMVVKYLNEAAVSSDASMKMDYLYKIKEITIHKAPELLPKYLKDILNFTTDRNTDVKKAVVGIIEEICKAQIGLLPKVVLNLHILLCDQSVPVQKRVVQTAISIYRATLEWICKASVISKEMEEAWGQLNKIKQEIANMIDNDNDGIRTSAVKFLECVVLLQTYPDEMENKRKNDFSLEDVPFTLKIARRRKLEEEASNMFNLLVKFHGSPHISSANLLACIGVLSNIAKCRAEFMIRVIDAITTLFNNLPPTLTTTQVNSVRKKIKTELGGLIRHPACFEYVDKLSPMLFELGYTQSDILKMISKPEERRRYCKRTLSSESSIQNYAKKSRYNWDDKNLTLSPLQMNINFISENLTLDKVIYLIITSMPKLPSVIPTHFIPQYNDILKKESISKQTLISTLATQFLEEGTGPGATTTPKFVVADEIKKKARESDNVTVQISKKERLHVSKVNTLKLSEITQPLETQEKETLLLTSINRLLSSDKARMLHQKVVTTLASSFGIMVRETILNHITKNIKSNVDVALSWLFEEYSMLQGFLRLPSTRKDLRLEQSYNKLLCSFVMASTNDGPTLQRIILEAPLITDDAIVCIQTVCKDEERCSWALGLLRDIIIRKPPKQIIFLNTLLSYTTYETAIVRETAISFLLDLYTKPDLKLVIEEFYRINLEFLKLNQPPEALSGIQQGRVKSDIWTESYIKACLFPIISLLQINQSLIHDLAKVYILTSPDIKRIILRLIEVSIKAMGMNSPQLLKLVEDCPRGAETLVTRVIHILTDKGPPCTQLVQHVRELYNTRVSDVRFLIPVINGLTKTEIISALPKLIKLNPVVVKEVFNRLLGLHGDSPISPSELLVTLHLIDQNKADLKTIIKATSMCLQEKQVFTQEVLAVVLQQLMEHTPIPTLLMRTVIQALSTYPRLSGFVMNILQRLILKQVWKQKIVWEGFVKCCQRTKPQSYSVLMQLPAPQLMEALTLCPDVRDSLKEHFMLFTDAQRQHIPIGIQDIVMGSKKIAENDTLIKTTLTQDKENSKTFSEIPSQSEPLPPGMD